MMKLYRSLTNDPYLNLAAEAELFRKKEDALFLWQNVPSVIAGRNQNLFAEADTAYCRKHNILPVRRYTGGGCVYHDLGNLNWSYFGSETEAGQITEKIAGILRQAGIPVSCSGRNDLVLEGRKCGGTAWLFEDNRVLVHGTLLISTDLEQMEKVLTPPALKLAKRNFTSVKARVINLQEYDPSLSVVKIISIFAGYYHEKDQIVAIDEKIKEEAEKLRREEWIFGSTPDYQVTQEIKTEHGIIQVSMNIHDGIIMAADCYHDCMDPDFTVSLFALRGLSYNPDLICDRISLLVEDKTKGV